MTNVTFNGITYSDQSGVANTLADDKHRQNLMPMFQNMMVEVSGIKGVASISTTSLAIGTGSKAFTLAALPGGQVYGFQTYMFLRAESAADATKFMIGRVVSLVAGVLTLDVAIVGGSGTAADWVIYPMVGQGLDVVQHSLDTVIDAADQVSFWDASAAALKRITLANLLSAAIMTRPADKFQDLGSVSGSQTVNLANGHVVKATITGSTTFDFSGYVASPNAGFIEMEIVNGGANVAIAGSEQWPGGVVPSLSGTGTDIITCRYRAGGTIQRWMVNGFGFA